jgi:O-antigen/teichoic acid export membrane protein
LTDKLLTKLKRDEMALIVAKGSLGTMIVHASGIAIASGLHILLARLMGVSEYGVYSYSISWVFVFVLLAKLGFDSVNLRFVATYKAARDLGRLKGVISRIHMLVLGTSLILVVVSSFAILILKEHINNSLYFTLWAGIFAAVVMSQLQLVSTSLRGLHRAVLSYLPDPILRPLILAVLAGILFLYNNKLMAFETMLLNCVSLISVLILGKVILKRSLPHDLRSALPEYETREWLRTALPLFFI